MRLDDPRRLPVVDSSASRLAPQFLNHVVQADPVEPGGEPVDPLGRLGAGERAELLDLVQAHGEHVRVRRLVDVGERLAQQPVAAGARRRRSCR